jgi:thiamine kinase-like enzyme
MDTNQNSNHPESQQENKAKGGNMSTTLLNEGAFIKYIPVSKYDYRIGIFQDRLFYNIKNLRNFAICKTIKYERDNTGNLIEVYYEVVNEKQWELDKESVAIISENMAKIHNHCYVEKDYIDLPIKNNLYNDITEWENIVKDSTISARNYQIRRSIFKEINRIRPEQVKIPLHRDFRKHNILWDGEKYTLIDFDFSAHDFISIEIAAFISDILDDENDRRSLDLIKEFMSNYIKHSEIKEIIWSDIISDYLNYLCVNTFPVYLKNTISEESFNILLNQRNENLIKLYKFQQVIKSIILEILEKNNNLK